jgi:hypothetical protein
VTFTIRAFRPGSEPIYAWGAAVLGNLRAKLAPTPGGWLLEHERAALELRELAADGKAEPDASWTVQLALHTPSERPEAQTYSGSIKCG